MFEVLANFVAKKEKKNKLTQNWYYEKSLNLSRAI